jgi:hypothetical protein
MVDETKAFTLAPPAKELALPGCPQGTFLEHLLFVTEKRPTSIAIGWSEPVCGRNLHPLESSAASRRTITSIDSLALGYEISLKHAKCAAFSSPSQRRWSFLCRERRVYVLRCTRNARSKADVPRLAGTLLLYSTASKPSRNERSNREYLGVMLWCVAIRGYQRWNPDSFSRTGPSWAM